MGLTKTCESEKPIAERGIYQTFAEQFLEEPVPEEQIKRNSDTYLARSIPVPLPTFCYWRKLPVIDDADWLE